MPRAIWKGHISFGLVNIPIVLYSAEQRQELSFHMIDRRDGARVRYQRVNESSGAPVPWDEIVKGYELDDEQHVLLNDDDFKQAAPEASQSIDIEEFVESGDIDLRYCDKPYYLAPGKKGEKGYVLLRETLQRTGKVAVAKVVIRTKEYLAALHPLDNALILILLRFAHELRSMTDLELPAGKLSDFGVSDKEVKMAQQLIESMTGNWEPEKYHDTYHDRLLHYIEEKAAAGDRRPAAKAAEEAPVGDVVNIMDLLQKSLSEKARPKAKTARRKTAKRKRA